MTKKIYPFILRFIATLCMLLVTLSAHIADAGDSVLDDIEIQSRPGSLAIVVKFNATMRYVTHTPYARGDFLQIQLQPVGSAGFDDDSGSALETKAWKPSKDLPLYEVTYEGDASGRPRLILKFKRKVDFTVRGGEDLRSVVVALKLKKPRKTSASPAKNNKKARPKHRVLRSTAKAPTKVDISHPYAINLDSSQQAITPDPASFAGLERYRVYTTRFKVRDRVWNRLRLGFFPSKENANEVLEILSEKFPQAWVVKVSRRERELSAQRAIAIPRIALAAAATSAAPAPLPKAPQKSEKLAPSRKTGKKTAAPPISEKRRAALMDEAEDAMKRGDYRRAIQLYTRVLQEKKHKDRQKAQELLGLARDRNGQLAHAKAEYEEYLRLYPKGEGADRVRQRLLGLITARVEPKGKLRQATKKKDEIQAYGSFSVFYYRNEDYTTFGDRIVNRDSLSTNMDVTTRKRTADYDIRTLFVGGYDVDFIDKTENEGRLNKFYVDALDRRKNISARIGRQSRSTGGVLGRFDGGLFGYKFTQALKLNLVGGIPIATSSLRSYETDKYFYGLSLDLGTFANRWDFSTFIINQEIRGITDRQAVGGEIRYFHSNASLFSLVDYDIFFNELNLALLTGNYIFANRSTINMTAEYRKSPILTTSNALQGQVGFETITELEEIFTIDEMRDLAEDRTASYKSVRLGAVQPLTEKFQISADCTVSELAETEASGGVAATPGTGYEYFYFVQLMGSSLITEGDITLLGLRYSDTLNTDIYSVNLNSRYPLTRKLRFNPRVIADLRKNKLNDAEQLKLRASMRFEYRMRKPRFRFELEGGGEWSDSKLTTGTTEKTKGYFVTVGYRVEF